MSITIELYCKECHSPLNAEMKRNGVISVEPCHVCLDMAYEDGHEKIIKEESNG